MSMRISAGSTSSSFYKGNKKVEDNRLEMRIIKKFYSAWYQK